LRTPFLHIAVKVINQLIYGHEDVDQLFPGDVAMIALAPEFDTNGYK